MVRLSVFLLALVVFACNSSNSPEEKTGYTYEQFASSFKNASLPFHLSDTFLLKNKDTAAIRDTLFSSSLQDSAINRIFGKSNKIKYIPLWKIEAREGVNYFITKVENKNRKAAFLFVFDKENKLTAGFPFLVPDNNPLTTEVSSIDKAFSISRSVFLKQPNGVTAEGKNVYAYDKNLKSFVLVMTDPLDEKNLELVNPIDTLSKLHKLAGDYTSDKRNIVSVRDGRKPNLLTVFIHIEKGSCTGELKADATITSPTTAICQQAGDPCILRLNFTASKLQLTELEGCGSKRGQGCSFNGIFSRKKQGTAKMLKEKSKNSKK
jgi:hypothetical protein